MAHVGTTTNLKQPAATGSPQRTGLWMAVFAAAVIAAIALAFVMTQLVGSKTANGALGGDLSYDQIEALRGVSVPYAVDRSDDQIEAQRGISPYLAPNLLDRDAGPRRIDSADLDRPAASPLRAAPPGSPPAAPASAEAGFNRDLQP